MLLCITHADQGFSVTIDITQNSIDFSQLHDRMQRYIDEGILPCVSTLVLDGLDVLDYACLGYQDLESKTPLRDDAIFQIHSNTKIVTSVAMMTLVERGSCALDDPLEKFIPSFANPTVLTADATSADDVEPATSPITLRQLLCHSSGLSYGFVDPSSLIDKTYYRGGFNLLAGFDDDLEALVEKLSTFPLAHQPGTAWRYSLATDVIARLVEIISGKPFDQFLAAHIFEPLGMVDTDFCVESSKLERVVTMYGAADMFKPMTPGLTQVGRHRSAPSSSPAFLSGGGGLYSTVADYLTFMRMLINGGEWAGARILQPETIDEMRTNQLAPGVKVNFPMWDMPGTVFGLGFAIKDELSANDPSGSVGEYHWGGMAGTHSWMSPNGPGGFCMTQVMPSFWHPFSHEFKQFVYDAVESQEKIPPNG